MSREDVERMIRFISASTSSLSLVNVHGACLTLPFRVVQYIAVDGEILWKYLGSVSTPNS